MAISNQAESLSIAELVKSKVHQYTHGRVRNLVVEESKGRVTVSGEVRTRHTKQLALQGALELLPSDCFCERITVV